MRTLLLLLVTQSTRMTHIVNSYYTNDETVDSFFLVYTKRHFP